MSHSSKHEKPFETTHELTATAGNDHLRGSPADDVISGLEGADRIRGNDGDDRLIGGPGNDRLWGGSGNDILQGHELRELFVTQEVNVMRGGKGDDVYIVQSLGDRVIEKAGQGADTVQTIIGYTLPDNVENLLVFDSFLFDGDPLVGNSLDNRITGASFAYDTIFGLDGNDTLDGGGRVGGFLDGGNGDDVLIQSYGESLGGAGADLFVAGGRGGNTSPEVPITVLDFNAAEGDRIHIASQTAYNGADLFESGQLRFEAETAKLIFDLDPSTDNARSVDQVIVLLGVQEFNPAWVTVGVLI